MLNETKMLKILITSLVVLCSLHVPKIIKLRQGIQMLQAKTSVRTTLVGPSCIVYCWHCLFNFLVFVLMWSI